VEPWHCCLGAGGFAPARASEARPHHRSGASGTPHTGTVWKSLQTSSLPASKQQASEIHVEVVCQGETQEGTFTPSGSCLRRHQRPVGPYEYSNVAGAPLSEDSVHALLIGTNCATKRVCHALALERCIQSHLLTTGTRGCGWRDLHWPPIVGCGSTSTTSTTMPLDWRHMLSPGENMITGCQYFQGDFGACQYC
jgi:hypothetical protein